jgi:hypothetical protein
VLTASGDLPICPLGFIGNMPAKHIKDAKVGATELVPQPFAINHLQAFAQTGRRPGCYWPVCQVVTPAVLFPPLRYLAQPGARRINFSGATGVSLHRLPHEARFR